MIAHLEITLGNNSSFSGYKATSMSQYPTRCWAEGEGKKREKRGENSLPFQRENKKLPRSLRLGHIPVLLTLMAVSALVLLHMLQVNMDTVSGTPQALAGHLVT